MTEIEPTSAYHRLPPAAQEAVNAAIYNTISLNAYVATHHPADAQEKDKLALYALSLLKLDKTTTDYPEITAALKRQIALSRELIAEDPAAVLAAQKLETEFTLAVWNDPMVGPEVGRHTQLTNRLIAIDGSHYNPQADLPQLRATIAGLQNV